MNKKILLAAMALPMLFTACSQDEYLDDYRGQSGMATPNVEGFDVTLAPNLGGDARAIWDNTAAKLTWEANKDLISMYWLGAPVTAASESAAPASLTGLYNSVFKTADGEAFSSESMVFVGGNIAVYPANTKFVEQGEIKISVPHVQDENVILEAPYISNYLNVTKENIGKNVPGYNNGLYSPVKLAVNVLYLFLELNNTAKLTKYHGFEIESVDIVASNKEFAKTASLYVSSEEVKDKGEYTPEEEDADPVATITGSVYAKGTADSIAISSTNIKKTAEGKYEVKFVVLPTQDAMANLDKDAKIVVNTNCGRLEVSTQQITKDNANKDVYTNVAKIPEAEEDEEAPVLVGTVTNPFNADTLYTIAEVLETIVTSHVADAKAESNFAGERIGMIFDRTIKADMGNATLNNSKVYSSDDIKKYIAIHTAMNSKEEMNLVLSSRTNKQFAGLTSEALSLVEKKNVYDDPSTDKDEENILVTLSSQDLSLDAAPVSVDSVWVSTPGAVYTPKAETWKGEAAKWILASGNWTMNDTYAPATNAVSKIINDGTLTIAGTENEDTKVQNILAPAIKNEGTIKIGGNNKLFLNGDFELGGTSSIEVAAGQDLRFAENIASAHDFQGTIKVAADGFLTVADGVSVYSHAKVENAGTLGSVGTSGGYYNEGTITVKDALATTLVQDNSKGTIKMYNRTDAIKVESEDKGEIIYTYTTANSANFTKTTTDKFTTVEFGSDIKTINLWYTSAQVVKIKDVNLTFNGTGAVVLNADATKNVEIANLKIGKNAHLKINPDNALTVNSVTNEGKVTAAGNIYYKESYTPNGEVISTGGSITPYDSKAIQNNITTQLKAALAADATAGTENNPVKIALTEDYSTLTHGIVFDGVTTLSRAASPEPIYVTLDLNGKTIANTENIWDDTDGVDKWSLISVKGNYVVTIKGNGKVHAKENDCYAVDVRDGAKVIIENGEFVGNISAIYTISGGSAEIKGGKYNIQQVHEKKQYGYLLNNYDKNTNKIKVTGGSFYKFNPANNDADPNAPVNFVPNGYTSTQNGVCKINCVTQ